MVGEKLTLRWGQPVIVENKPGGALHLGTEAVARSAPDGYTLLLAPQGPLVLSPSLYRKLSYDPAAFVPVTVLARLPYVFVVNPNVPVSTIPELIAFAKANPDKLNFGTPGTGSAQHLAVEWFKILAGVRLTHVPYRGAAPAMADLLAGHVQLMCDNAANVLPQVREGKLSALAIGAPPRIAELPDVPAMAELFPGFLASSWFSLVAPPKTPSDVVTKLSQAIAEALAHARRGEAPAGSRRHAGGRHLSKPRRSCGRRPNAGARSSSTPGSSWIDRPGWKWRRRA